MSRRPLWQQIYERFDPDRAAGVPSWRADRPLSPAEAIAESLDLPFGNPSSGGMHDISIQAP
jgi:hypothetical protein